MTLELFGVIIAKLHPDYLPFYCAIIVGLVLLVQIYRKLRILEYEVYYAQKTVNCLAGEIFEQWLRYTKRMEQVKDP